MANKLVACTSTTPFLTLVFQISHPVLTTPLQYVIMVSYCSHPVHAQSQLLSPSGFIIGCQMFWAFTGCSQSCCTLGRDRHSLWMRICKWGMYGHWWMPAPTIFHTLKLQKRFGMCVLCKHTPVLQLTIPICPIELLQLSLK